VNLNHPLSKEIREYWNQHCIWYQIFGGSGPLDRLRARLNRLLDRRATLLRQAPTDVVREKMAKLETTKGFLEHELAFMEVGYIARPPNFSWHGSEIKPDEPLSSIVPANSPQIEIVVEPCRVGLGPGIVLLVSCVGRKGNALVDEFTAWLPCEHEGHPGAEQLIRAYGYPGEDYADITMQDLLVALESIFKQRRPEYAVQESGSMLQYCGRRLDEEERAETIFINYEGEGLYTERIEVVMDLHLRPPKAEFTAADSDHVQAAVQSTLTSLVQSVADTF